MAKCSCAFQKKESWSAFQPKKETREPKRIFLSKGSPQQRRDLSGVNGSRNAAICRCSDLERPPSSAVTDGCDYKRSAVSSLLSDGEAGMVLPKICVLEIIFSSCFMILAMSAGFLNPSGSGVSSAATVNRKS